MRSSKYAAALDLMGHVDGLALLSPRTTTAQLRKIARQSVPTVLVNRIELGVELPMIAVDSFAAMLELCAHPAELGHRRVVYLSGNELAWQDHERRRGVQSSRFLGIDPERVECDGTIATSYEVPEQVLTHEPTALICFNDLSAVGAISRLRELGVDVPADISVTGFDDIVIGRHLTPT